MMITNYNGTITISDYDMRDDMFTRRYMFYTLTQAKKMFKQDLFKHNMYINQFVNHEA